MKNIPIKYSYELNLHRKFYNPIDIIYPCVLYLPIFKIKQENCTKETVWDCTQKKWKEVITSTAVILTFDVYGRLFQCRTVKESGIEVGIKKFVYLTENTFRLASLEDMINYEMNREKSLFALVKGFEYNNSGTHIKLSLRSKYAFQDKGITILARVDDDVSFPNDIVGLEISRYFYSEACKRPTTYSIGESEIKCFYVEKRLKSIEEPKVSTMTLNDNKLLYNSKKYFNIIIVLVLIILSIIMTFIVLLT